MCGPPISQSAWMARSRTRRSRYSFGILAKFLGSTLSVNCGMPLPARTIRRRLLGGGLHDPADGLGAGAPSAHADEARHGADRFLQRHLAACDLALLLRPVLGVDRRAIRLRQARENVGDVLLDVGEGRAVRADHLERGLATTPEEAPVRETEQVFRFHPVHRLAGLDPRESRVGLVT